MTYALTAIKRAGGEETPRFEAKITKDGKVVGMVSNGGTGGSCRYSFDGREGNLFDAWIDETQPDGFEPNDAWVYRRLEEADVLKTLLRLSWRHTVFRLHKEPPAYWRTIKATYRGPTCPAAVWLRDKYAGKGTFFDPASKAWVEIT